MIDIYKSFDDYTKNYDMTKEKIKLKYNHSFRVMNLSEKYAKILGFNEEDIYLAKIIGLLHDIGRFEQLRIYDTFSDLKSIDHASLGVKILFEDNLIKNFYDKEEDYEIIKFAIENHNKMILPVIDDERAMMHAKLIRDTDKLDIIYLEGRLDELKIVPTDDNLSNVILEAVKNKTSVNRKDIKNINDSLANNFIFAFDINYDECLEELKDNYMYYYKKINTYNKFTNIYNEIIKYIDERIDKNVRKQI